MDLAVMYHYVRERESFTGSVPIEPADFLQQVQYGKRFYEVSTPSNIRKEASNFLVTFDDATRDQYTIAYEILKAEQVKGYFAIMSGPLVHKKIPIFHLVHAILSKLDDQLLWEDINKHFDIPANIHELSSIYHYEQHMYRRYNKYALNFFLQEDVCRDYLELKMQEIYGSLDEFLQEFYIQPNEIIEMHKNGMEMGVHCVHHRPYGGDAQAFYDAEIQPCKEYLTSLLGEAPKWYTPAFGGGENTALMLKELTPILKANGFVGGFTVIEGFCDLAEDDFWHNRVDCNKLNAFLHKNGLDVHAEA